MKLEDAITHLSARAEAQAQRVTEKYGPFASAHEAHSVIREELEEFFDEVRKKRELRSKLALRNECIDIAAAALRYAAQMEVEMHGGPKPIPTEEEP